MITHTIAIMIKTTPTVMAMLITTTMAIHMTTAITATPTPRRRIRAMAWPLA